MLPLAAGIDSNAIVQTSNGQISMKVIKIGDKILCRNMTDLSKTERSVSSIEEIKTSEIIEITTVDNVTIKVAVDQKVFMCCKWVEARDLCLNDMLFTKDGKMVQIVGLKHLKLDNPIILRFIVVDEHHNYLAGENGVLIHNGAGGAAAGVIIGASAVQGAYGAATTIIGIGATALLGPVAAGTIVTVWGYWTFFPALATTKVVACATGLALGVATGPI